VELAAIRRRGRVTAPSFDATEMKRGNVAQQSLPLCITAAQEEKILRRLFHGYPSGLAARPLRVNRNGT
jgi:hypothetical protein